MTQIIYTPTIDNKKSVFLYQSNFLSEEVANQLLNFAKTQDMRNGWCVSGKEIPRKQLWFQKDGHYFCDAWKQRYDRWNAVEIYPDILNKIATLIKQNTELATSLKNHDIDLANMDINSCLINMYRDGTDSIRAHKDTYLSFGQLPIIIGISLGDSRILRVRRLHNPDSFKSLRVQKNSDENIDFLLEHNSLFIMAGYSQIFFSHEIPKMEDKQCRYSFTFREFTKPNTSINTTFNESGK
jgi:hypothetical protein